jgi:taurine dioxygenase
MTDLLPDQELAPLDSLAPLHRAIEVHPLSGHTGAEISGIDISTPLNALERGVIDDALATWKVVVFRDQHIDHAQQIAFARQFGELTHAHPYDNDPPEGFPEIFTVSPERFAKQYGITGEAAKQLRKRYSYTNDWHTDVTPAVNPPAASVLRADVVPEYGGDTTFTNLVAAYEGLSAPLRGLLDGLDAEHRYGASFARRGVPTTSVINDNPLIANHPVVRVHPTTGERGLFVNDGFTSKILGLHPDESAALLALLLEHVTRPAYTVRIRWAPGTVAFWDNRVTSHLGPQDIDHLDVERVLHRVTLIGEVPVGVDGRDSVLVAGQPFESLPITS